LLNDGFTDVVEDWILRIVLLKADSTIIEIVELDMGSDADCKLNGRSVGLLQ